MQWLPVVYTCMLSTSTAVFTSGWTPVVITVAVSLAVPCVQMCAPSQLLDVHLIPLKTQLNNNYSYLRLQYDCLVAQELL